MPCCFASDPQREVSDALEKILAQRKVLQGQRHELRVRINDAPKKLDVLRQQVRKSLKAHAEIVRLQRLYRAKNAHDRNAATSAAAALASSPFFEEARLLERMGLEPDMPCLLLEAWSLGSDSVFLGEQWLNWDLLRDEAPKQRIEVALEPRILLSREDARKPSMQSTCGGSLLGSGNSGNLLLHFSQDDTRRDKVLSRLQLSSKQPWKQPAIPSRVVLKIWSWGGSAECLKAEPRRAETHKDHKGQKNLQKTQKTIQASGLSCWLEAIQAEVDARQKKDRAVNENWLQVGSSGDEVLVIGRHHALIQRLLEDKKEFLSCISREHLRLWFDCKSEILSIENLSSNQIVIQNGVSSSTVPAGKVARAQSGDILRFVAPDSLRKAANADSFLLFRIVVQKPIASCGGRKCQGGGGDSLYTVITTDETLEHQTFCGGCCAQLHLEMSTFKQTHAILPPSWKLLCESHAVEVDIVATADSHSNGNPNDTQPPSGLWAADFGSQKLHLPFALAQRAALKEKQVERRKAQLEHAKRAEAERLEEEAERRKRMLEYNLAEDIDPEQEDLCEAGAKPGRANVHTGLTPAPKSFAPEPRVIQSIEKATEEPQVPRELQGFGPDSTEDYMEALDRPAEQRKRRILHDAEPIMAQTDSKENHQRLLRLLCQKFGLLYRGEHMEIHAAVHQASLATSLTAKVTLHFAPLDGRTFSRLEATLHMDFGALHCECDQTVQTLADGVPTVLFEEQMSSFKQLMDFELMDVLGQPPVLDLKAYLLQASSEEAVNIQLRVPLLTTSFLKPLRPTFRFSQEWDAPDLQAAANVESTADWMRPEHAAALTLGGSLQLFHLTKDIIGLAAELPAHGCHEPQAVLVRIAAFADGKMTVQTRSQEVRLAHAVAAAMASVLLCPPAEI